MQRTLDNSTVRKQTAQLKDGQISEWVLHQRRHTEGRKAYEKMLGHHYIIRESHIKTTMGCHHRPVKMAEIRNTDITKCWQGCGTPKNSHSLQRGMQNCTATLEDSWAIFLFTKLKTILPYNSAVASLSIYTD